MFELKIVSGLEKCFLDQSVSDFDELSELYVFRGERFSFQLIYKQTDIFAPMPFMLQVRTTGDFSGKVNIRTVENVPVTLPVYHNSRDDNYLRDTPGLYPDVLVPLKYDGCTPSAPGQLRGVWFECEGDREQAGTSEITVILKAGDTEYGRASLCIHTADTALDHADFKLTQWFHYDCLAHTYNVEVFSPKHWEITENYIKTAVKNGINTILTPVFTPPLDTMVGHERLTVQLVGVKVQKGKYKFDFSLLSRFVDMCLSCKVEYFEISHLFTQWGAGHAPKIMAEVNGKETRIFGWETDSCGEEYRAFLAAFLPRLTAFFKRKGISDRVLFHISDEPSGQQLEQYTRAKAGVEKYLKGFTVIDALSNVEFFKAGVIENPVPGCDHVEEFIKAGVQHPWTYYCCGQGVKVPNRFIAMPQQRNRIIGILFYKFRIEGFLQWGYNFYNNCGSADPIEPFLSTSGDQWVPAGDTCSVWPCRDGTAYESTRITAFYDGLQDMRALYTLEKRLGRDRVLALLEEGLEKPLTFFDYPKDAKYILDVRKRINELI